MEDWDIKTIVLGYDGSEGADRAFRLASAVARQNNARIFVVTAFRWDHVDGLGEKASREIGTAQDTSRSLPSSCARPGSRPNRKRWKVQPEMPCFA